MKTDIDIALEAEMKPIQEVAARLDIAEDELIYTVSTRQN